MLHAKIEELSGYEYDLYHVLHNNASVGGVSNRRRYFFVCSRVPFGVDHYPLEYVPTFGDMLRDLTPLGLTMHEQPYKGTQHRGDRVEILNSSRWCRDHVHDGTGWVDGHDVSRSPSYDRVVELCEVASWEQGESISDVLRKYHAEHGKLPRSWYYTTTVDVLDDFGEKIPVLDGDGNQAVNKNTKKPLWQTVQMPKADRLIETDFAMGHNQQVRWRDDRLANVVTGGACHLVLHPTLPRTLTQREAARIQGFPDAWKIYPVRDAPDLGPGWGKGVPVHAGHWIGEWARSSLDGTPGPIRGIPLAQYNKKLGILYGAKERELVVDLSNDFKAFV
jgi:site-specific DNA-cytosine methylase